MKRISYIIVILLFLGTSCEKEEILPKTGYEEVALTSGYDCAYLFQKEDGKILAPTNLADFISDYHWGNKYLIRYKLAEQQLSLAGLRDVLKKNS